MAKKHDLLDESKPVTFLYKRKSGYAKNCKTGFRDNYHNAHHVVPCTSLHASLEKFLKSKPIHYNKALARFTAWNVNAGTNLIGLPHKNAYMIAYKETKASKLPVKRQWLTAPATSLKPHLPIHLPTSWGHTIYNLQVKGKLDKIWGQLNVKAEKHEPVDANDLGPEVQAVSNAFRAKLEAKVGQTKALWNAKQYALFRMD